MARESRRKASNVMNQGPRTQEGMRFNRMRKKRRTPVVSETSSRCADFQAS